jgi:hypothetical protein
MQFSLCSEISKLLTDQLIIMVSPNLIILDVHLAWSQQQEFVE